MDKEKILIAAQHFIHAQFSGESTGHDYFHTERVVKNAKAIAQQEKADSFLIELSAWLHDLGDAKLNNGTDKSKELITQFLSELNVNKPTISQVVEIVSQVSFSKGEKAKTLEAKIVQDADRLDAIGAIGLARIFAFGGSRHREIYNPENPKDSSIQHFYDKLLKLKDLMHTETAKAIALDRHQYMKAYLERFYKEWNGDF